MLRIVNKTKKDIISLVFARVNKIKLSYKNKIGNTS